MDNLLFTRKQARNRDPLRDVVNFDVDQSTNTIAVDATATLRAFLFENLVNFFLIDHPTEA